MADKRPQIAVAERPEQGSRAVRRLRKEGFVPGVVYGGGDGDCVAFKVNERELWHAMHTGAALFDLKIGNGKALPVIVKDQQRHPVRDELMHVDLLKVRLDEKIQTPVPVELSGVEEAPGVKEGGVLEHVTRELNVEALPTDIPERIDVDVSHMESAGTMHLSELTAPAGAAFLDDPEETIIATITMPTEEPAEPEVEEETELVGEEGEELEAVAEGEVPAEGEGEAAAEGEAEASAEES
jgi:large subunit ribosomal protein L25